MRAEHGLTDEQIEAQRRLHGANALPEPPPRPAWRLFARQFASPLIYILFVAAALAVALGQHGDAGVILGVVLVNALIGAFQEGRAERSMAALRRLAALQVRVLRDGARAAWSRRATWCRATSCCWRRAMPSPPTRACSKQPQLQVAEAALTGESLPVAKSADAAARGHAAWPTGATWSTPAPTSPPDAARAVVVATGAAHGGRAHRRPDRERGRNRRRRSSSGSRSSAACCVAAAVGLFVLVVRARACGAGCRCPRC